MNKKNKHLDCYTDNLAFPEVHVEDVKTENDENENNSESGVIFDNLAIPEIKKKVQEKEKITKNDFLFIFRKSFFLFHIRDIFSYLLFHTDNVLVKLLS